MALEGARGEHISHDGQAEHANRSGPIGCIMGYLAISKEWSPLRLGGHPVTALPGVAGALVNGLAHDSHQSVPTARVKGTAVSGKARVTAAVRLETCSLA
jgi:hypothetical protein